jgi:ferric-dicitrate binding protein FerR (iron transport regulator)
MSRRRIFALLTGILLVASAAGLSAERAAAPRALGFVASRGSVWIDQQPAPSGAALFAGSVVKTGKSSVAVLQLASGTAATLEEESELALLAASRPEMQLNRGVVLVRNASQQATRISVLGSSVEVEGEAGFPALCRIAWRGRSAEVFAEQGRVAIHGPALLRGPQILAPGKVARLGAGGPQAAGEQAGKVSNAIPAEVVQREGKGAEIQLKVPDPVHWEDVVRTLKTGRVRIALLDGSFLNVGARSVMRIVKHDVQSQQTEVELQLGRLRGEVVKITKPGGSFQVRTQTAVIGVVGTIFVIDAQARLTRVSCIQGALSVRNINPAIVGTATLQAGQSTMVPAGVAPASPVSTVSRQLQQEVRQTNAGEPPSPQMSSALQTQGLTPAQVASTTVQPTAVTGAQAGSAVANVASTTAGTTSATLSGVALSDVNGANDTLAQTTSSLQEATTQTQSAAATAAQTVETVSDVNVGLQNVIELISASEPGCGCIP